MAKLVEFIFLFKIVTNRRSFSLNSRNALRGRGRALEEEDSIIPLALSPGKTQRLHSTVRDCLQSFKMRLTWLHLRIQ
jgi:hypothetical protein